MGPDRNPYLVALGQRIRALRERQGESQAGLGRRSGLSARFVSSVEGGSGNISVLRLLDLARALGCAIQDLLPPVSPSAAASPVVALVGLRGAGKSSLGRSVAVETGTLFVEHDELVEAAAGIPLADVFGLEGDGHYRVLVRETLDRFLATVDRPAILAASGGIVTDEIAWETLRRRTVTVWLRADARDHWDRVAAQGDLRPMNERPRAREELARLLLRREALYAGSAHVIDTSRLGFEASVRALRAIVDSAGRISPARAPSPRG